MTEQVVLRLPTMSIEENLQILSHLKRWNKVETGLALDLSSVKDVNVLRILIIENSSRKLA